MGVPSVEDVADFEGALNAFRRSLEEEEDESNLAEDLNGESNGLSGPAVAPIADLVSGDSQLWYKSSQEEWGVEAGQEDWGNEEDVMDLSGMDLDEAEAGISGLEQVANCLVELRGTGGDEIGKLNCRSARNMTKGADLAQNTDKFRNDELPILEDVGLEGEEVDPAVVELAKGVMTESGAEVLEAGTEIDVLDHDRGHKLEEGCEVGGNSKATGIMQRDEQTFKNSKGDEGAEKASSSSQEESVARKTSQEDEEGRDREVEEICKVDVNTEAAGDTSIVTKDAVVAVGLTVVNMESIFYHQSLQGQADKSANKNKCESQIEDIEQHLGGNCEAAGETPARHKDSEDALVALGSKDVISDDLLLPERASGDIGKNLIKDLEQKVGGNSEAAGGTSTMQKRLEDAFVAVGLSSANMVSICEDTLLQVQTLVHRDKGWGLTKGVEQKVPGNVEAACETRVLQEEAEDVDMAVGESNVNMEGISDDPSLQWPAHVLADGNKEGIQVMEQTVDGQIEAAQEMSLMQKRTEDALVTAVGLSDVIMDCISDDLLLQVISDKPVDSSQGRSLIKDMKRDIKPAGETSSVQKGAEDALVAVGLNNDNLAGISEDLLMQAQVDELAEGHSWNTINDIDEKVGGNIEAAGFTSTIENETAQSLAAGGSACAVGMECISKDSLLQRKANELAEKDEGRSLIIEIEQTCGGNIEVSGTMAAMQNKTDDTLMALGSSDINISFISEDLLLQRQGDKLADRDEDSSLMNDIEQKVDVNIKAAGQGSIMQSLADDAVVAVGCSDVDMECSSDDLKLHGQAEELAATDEDRSPWTDIEHKVDGSIKPVGKASRIQSHPSNSGSMARAKENNLSYIGLAGEEQQQCVENYEPRNLGGEAHEGVVHQGRLEVPRDCMQLENGLAVTGKSPSGFGVDLEDRTGVEGVDLLCSPEQSYCALNLLASVSQVVGLDSINMMDKVSGVSETLTSSVHILESKQGNAWSTVALPSVASPTEVSEIFPDNSVEIRVVSQGEEPSGPCSSGRTSVCPDDSEQSPRRYQHSEHHSYVHAKLASIGIAEGAQNGRNDETSTAGLEISEENDMEDGVQHGPKCSLLRTLSNIASSDKSDGAISIGTSRSLVDTLRMVHEKNNYSESFLLDTSHLHVLKEGQRETNACEILKLQNMSRLEGDLAISDGSVAEGSDVTMGAAVEDKTPTMTVHNGFEPNKGTSAETEIKPGFSPDHVMADGYLVLQRDSARLDDLAKAAVLRRVFVDIDETILSSDGEDDPTNSTSENERVSAVHGPEGHESTLNVPDSHGTDITTISLSGGKENLYHPNDKTLIGSANGSGISSDCNKELVETVEAVSPHHIGILESRNAAHHQLQHHASSMWSAHQPVPLQERKDMDENKLVDVGFEGQDGIGCNIPLANDEVSPAAYSSISNTVPSYEQLSGDSSCDMDLSLTVGLQDKRASAKQVSSGQGVQGASGLQGATSRSMMENRLPGDDDFDTNLSLHVGVGRGFFRKVSMGASAASSNTTASKGEFMHVKSPTTHLQAEASPQCRDGRDMVNWEGATTSINSSQFFCQGGDVDAGSVPGNYDAQGGESGVGAIRDPTCEGGITEKDFPANLMVDEISESLYASCADRDLLSHKKLIGGSAVLILERTPSPPRSSSISSITADVQVVPEADSERFGDFGFTSLTIEDDAGGRDVGPFRNPPNLNLTPDVELRNRASMSFNFHQGVDAISGVDKDVSMSRVLDEERSKEDSSATTPTMPLKIFETSPASADNGSVSSSAPDNGLVDILVSAASTKASAEEAASKSLSSSCPLLPEIVQFDPKGEKPDNIELANVCALEAAAVIEMRSTGNVLAGAARDCLDMTYTRSCHGLSVSQDFQAPPDADGHQCDIDSTIPTAADGAAISNMPINGRVDTESEGPSEEIKALVSSSHVLTIVDPVQVSQDDWARNHDSDFGDGAGGTDITSDVEPTLGNTRVYSELRALMDLVKAQKSSPQEMTSLPKGVLGRVDVDVAPADSGDHVVGNRELERVDDALLSGIEECVGPVDQSHEETGVLAGEDCTSSSVQSKVLVVDLCSPTNHAKRIVQKEQVVHDWPPMVGTMSSSLTIRQGNCDSREDMLIVGVGSPVDVPHSGNPVGVDALTICQGTVVQTVEETVQRPAIDLNTSDTFQGLKMRGRRQGAAVQPYKPRKRAAKEPLEGTVAIGTGGRQATRKRRRTTKDLQAASSSTELMEKQVAFGTWASPINLNWSPVEISNVQEKRKVRLKVLARKGTQLGQSQNAGTVFTSGQTAPVIVEPIAFPVGSQPYHFPFYPHPPATMWPIRLMDPGIIASSPTPATETECPSQTQAGAPSADRQHLLQSSIMPSASQPGHTNSQVGYHLPQPLLGWPYTPRLEPLYAGSNQWVLPSGPGHSALQEPARMKPRQKAQVSSHCLDAAAAVANRNAPRKSRRNAQAPAPAPAPDAVAPPVSNGNEPRKSRRKSRAPAPDLDAAAPVANGDEPAGADGPRKRQRRTPATGEINFSQLQQDVHRVRSIISRRLEAWGSHSNLLQEAVTGSELATGDRHLIFDEQQREEFVQRMVTSCQSNPRMRTLFLGAVRRLADYTVMTTAASKSPCEAADEVLTAWKQMKLQPSASDEHFYTLCKAVDKLHSEDSGSLDRLLASQDPEFGLLDRTAEGKWDLRILLPVGKAPRRGGNKPEINSAIPSPPGA